MLRITVTTALTAMTAATLSATLVAGPTLAAPIATTRSVPVNAGIPDARDVLAGVNRLLPREAAYRAQLDARLGIERQAQFERLAEVIRGGDYQCGPAGFSTWVDEAMAGWTDTDLIIVFFYGTLPIYDAMLNEPSGPQRFGVDGEYADEVKQTFGRLRGFWDTDGSDIQLAAMHGTALMDDARMVPLMADLYDIPQEEAQTLIDIVQRFLDQPRFDHGNHPLLTLNAFAYDEEGRPPANRLGVGDKIVVGDGILAVMEEIGLGDVAPQGIVAHEDGHRVQFDLGRFVGGARTPEAGRASELEADALASAMWGSSLIEGRGKAHVLGARTVVDRFATQLPAIVAPDA